jgi:stage II sporulation protein E
MENLPLGAFQTVDLDVVRRRLEEGDYVIMMTDGILEAMICAGMEEKLTEFISSLTLQNPRDMAKDILKYCIASCKGQIQDDMSVLVFGMWKS